MTKLNETMIPRLDSESPEAIAHRTNYNSGYWSGIGALEATASCIEEALGVITRDRTYTIDPYDTFVCLLGRIRETGTMIPEAVRGIGQHEGMSEFFTLEVAGLKPSQTRQVRTDFYEKTTAMNQAMHDAGFPLFVSEATPLPNGVAFVARFSLDWPRVITHYSDSQLVELLGVLANFLRWVHAEMRMYQFQTDLGLSRLPPAKNREAIYVVGFDYLLNIRKARVIACVPMRAEEELVKVLQEIENEDSYRYEFTSYFTVP